MSLRSASAWIVVLTCCVPAAAQDRGVQPVNRSVADKTDVDPLLAEVKTAIDTTSRRYLEAETHTPWQIFHGILALRQDFKIKKDGEKINALDWLSKDAHYKGTHYFRKTQWGGQAQPYTKPYIFQGHPCQFLAILTMSNLPEDHTFHFGSESITIRDMINHAKAEVNAEEEITWVLWALGHYLPSDAVWQNKRGETWSIERLVQIQTRADVYKAACGGTHGMFALSVARNNYLAEGKQLRGIWMEADQKIRRYVETARYYQNEDGSFSNSHFQGRSYSYDFNTRIASSGHQLEFLMMSLSQRRLKEDWVRRGITATVKDLIEHKASPADCGPLYHALSGLRIYYDRVAPKVAKIEEQPDADLKAEEKPADSNSETIEKQPKPEAKPSPAKSKPLTKSETKQSVKALKPVDESEATDSLKPATKVGPAPKIDSAIKDADKSDESIPDESGEAKASYGVETDDLQSTGPPAPRRLK